MPDDKKARILAEQWPIPSNIKELRAPGSDPNALSTLDHQSRRMESKLAQTNSLLGKALIPLIRCVDENANSQNPTMMKTYKFINDSLCMLLPVFSYLNLMIRDLITDKLKQSHSKKQWKIREVLKLNC